MQMHTHVTGQLPEIKPCPPHNPPWGPDTYSGSASMAEMSTEEAKQVLAETEGADGDLVKRLRSVANAKITAAEEAALSTEDAAELAGFRRSALFDKAGIGNTEATEKLFRQALSSRDDLTVEMIQAEAAQYGLGSEKPSNPATPEEVQAHAEIERISGEAPAELPSIEERMKSATSLEDLRELEKQAGLVTEGEEFLDIF